MKKIILILMMIMLAPVSPWLNPVHSVETNADYTASPPFIGDGVPPLVMMLMGRDHKLYYEAYNDASDIDDDGQLDIGYKHSIDYYGYFDPKKCYKYDSTGTAKFVPFRTNTDKKCGGADEWSGNFLNWLTTSRMDALRKVMYGGYRSTDSTSLTVLEGEYRPQDAHSWGKEVNGAELTGATVRDLTPFDDPAGGTLPTAAVTWGGAGYNQKILLVTYDDSQANRYGNDHNDLVSSYSLCDYKSYSYITEFNDASITNSAAGKTYSRRINSNHIDTGNFFLVTEFEVTAGNAGNWSFAVDGDDGVEVEIDGTVAASYYGNHAECWTQATPQPAAACNASQINTSVGLNVGWHRMIVRHRANTGNDGVKVYYKKPGDASWIVFGATKNVANANITQLTYRAPNVLSTESIRFMKDTFITTGEPAFDASGTGTVTCNNKRHLYCVTSLSEDATPVFRLLKDKTNRIWEWASKERPVCDTSLGVPTDYFVRVEVCNPAVGFESNCKTYPNGANPNKPTGLFQKYGESTEKVCSKSFNACNTDSNCAGSPERCIDRGQMFFGLMTGSYTKNLSGGVLRWNLDSITHAVDNKNVGQIKTSSDNLISTLDKMRIKGFRYSDQSYQDTGANCGWITGSGLSEGQCRMWGNPVAEMMYEAERYFAGKGTPTTDFSAGTNAVGTDDRVLGLPNAGENPTAGNNWIAPYSKYPNCSKPFVIVLSDVNPSYDSDQLPGVDSDFGAFAGDLPGLNVKTIADAIGVEEGINGTNAFIGQVDNTTDSVCSSKSVSGLGSVRGLCPEEPTKKGSYYSAAVANYGKTQFNADTGKPNITTYSVALISPVPEIKIDVNGKEVKIIPVGKSVSGCLGVNTACNSRCTLTHDPVKGIVISNCAANAYCPSNQIVDFYIDTLATDYGNFRVNFEDVEQGADHDMDAIVQYSYQVSGNDVTINLNSAYAAGCIDQAMGFVVSGTTEDGVYLPVRDTDAGTVDGDTPAVLATDTPTIWSHTFTASAGGSTAKLLNDPLWYAAKWGGFEDRNGNNKPDLQNEWDKVNNVTGGEGGDGVPDTYFKISNPLKMEQQLTKVFSDILKKSASGTSVSILATSAEGEGALYQAYFYPEKVMTDGNKRDWIGYCRGLFLDAYGNLRDDCSSANPLSCNSTPDAKLIFDKDNIVRMRLDTATNEVKADLYRDANEDGSADNVIKDASIGVDEMSALWEAGTKLALRDKWTRNIYTWVDLDNDGKVDNGDFSIWGGEARDLWDAWTLMPYLKADSFTGSTGPWMDAAALTYYIIGYDMSNWGGGWPTTFRKRCIPVPGATTEWGCTGATDRVWALGDIVYSTPTVVAFPKEQYDQIYGGKSNNYAAFRSKYKDRRHIVYVGANDGMLHAFNAGVYTAGDDVSTGPKEHGSIIPNPTSGNGWTLPLPTIGDELWAFVPYDNLPHLKWLTHGDYSHVYYVDLKPKPTDVRIFCDSDGSLNPPASCVDGQIGASHPGGWGTILIVGMRFGGGAIGVDLNADGDTIDAGETFRSAYYVLDVTDPERPPRLLWRFTDPNLGFTTTYPGIIHIGGTSDKWFMVVGSGPNNFLPPSGRGYDGTSTQQGRIFIVNLLDGSKSMTFTNLGVNNVGAVLDSNMFMGDPTVVDGDLDFTDDVVYMGSVINTNDGKVFRLNPKKNPDPANWELSVLINQGRPLLVGPSVSKDSSGKLWVYFGTGRLLNDDDKRDSNDQYLFGIKDGCWRGSGPDAKDYLASVTNNVVTPPYTETFCNVTYDKNTNLFNASNLAVCAADSGGGVYDTTSGSCATDQTTYGTYYELIAAAKATNGWKVALKDPNAPDTPSERVLSRTSILGGIVLATTFTPSSDVCSYQGESRLRAVYYETGTAYNKSVIGTSDPTTAGSGGGGQISDGKGGSIAYGGTDAADQEIIFDQGTLGQGLPTTVGVAVGRKTKGFIQTSTGAIVEVEAQPALGIKSGAAGWREKTGGGGTSEVEMIYKHIVK